MLGNRIRIHAGSITDLNAVSGKTNRQSIIVSTVGFILVRVVGLEPTRLTAEEPKSSESTNSTIPAYIKTGHACFYSK